MAKQLHLYLTLLLSLFGLPFCQGQEQLQPKVEGDYRAIGEIVYPNLQEIISQVYFEEYFTDFKAYFSLNGAITDVTFIENVKAGKTWKIEGQDCYLYNTNDWEEEHIPPDLRVYETENGNPVFPIRQLLNLKKEHFVDSPSGTVVYRGINTKRYNYKIPLDGSADTFTDISAYWSDGSMNTPSKYKEVPVGYKIVSHYKDGKQKHQYININMFFHSDENWKRVEPIRGIFCPGAERHDMLKDKIKQIGAFSFSSELISGSNMEIKDIDVWLDPGSNLSRHDFTPDDPDFSSLPPARITRIASMNQGSGMVYEITHRRNSEDKCLLKKVQDVKFESQILVPEEKATNLEAFFGFDSTEYYTIGRTSENGVRCQLYHGLRIDWPPDKKNITTLWEWCIVNMTDTKIAFGDEHLPLVSLNIYVTKSPYSMETDVFYEGQKFTHHFYHVHTPKKKFDSNYFDISPCFTDDQMDVLQFFVTMPASLVSILKDDMNNLDFISSWRDAIFKAAGLEPYSLRISKPILDFPNTTDGMTVRFSIMDRHSNISEEVEPVSIEDGIANVRKAVNNGGLAFSYSKGGKKYELKAQPGSLKQRQLHDLNIVKSENGYSSGTMAGVAIVMLLIGAALGVLGIFLKKKFFDRR